MEIFCLYKTAPLFLDPNCDARTFLVAKQKLFIFCYFFLRYCGDVHPTMQTIACLTYVTLSCLKLDVVSFPILACFTVRNAGRQHWIVVSKTRVFLGFLVVIRIVVILFFSLFNKILIFFIYVEIQVFKPKFKDAHACRVLIPTRFIYVI